MQVFEVICCIITEVFAKKHLILLVLLYGKPIQGAIIN